MEIAFISSKVPSQIVLVFLIQVFKLILSKNPLYYTFF